ncbi:hypothetical protein ACIQV3_32640 [Streptomyces sp. NPDC099050]|uniref:hypothetical protein n=1 Tax=Streptomyces sp. NPDC099050 TaxID=3366100 RepID=UPI003827F769
MSKPPSPCLLFAVSMTVITVADLVLGPDMGVRAHSFPRVRDSSPTDASWSKP